MNLPLEEQLVNKLIENNLHISCAESCTGGLVASRLVNVANASKVFDVSFVTYANEAKIKYLGVSPETIVKYGVVSEEVVLEMAAGVAKETGAQVGIAVSGIAGPGGGSEEKPVGTVYVAVVWGEREDVQLAPVRRKWSDRSYTRHTSASFALSRVLRMIK